MSSACEAPFLKFVNKSLFMELLCCKPVCRCGVSSRAGLPDTEGRLQLNGGTVGPPRCLLGPSPRGLGWGHCPPAVLRLG